MRMMDCDLVWRDVENGGSTDKEDQGGLRRGIGRRSGMTPSWFILSLLALNVGACVTLAVKGSWPWALIYAGAAMIQTGSWLLTR